MKVIPRNIESLRRGGGIENGQDTLHGVQQVGPDAAAVAALIQPFQAAMLEAPNHQDTP
jgi:hypothetical protein